MTGFLLVLLYFVLAGAAAFILMQPKEFRVTRSATIDAPPKAVFDQINNLKNWEAWSPWAKLDPAANTGYEGPGAGIGARFNWSSKVSTLGVGQLEIIDSHPTSETDLRLEMRKPFAATNLIIFTLSPASDETPSRSGWWFSRLLGFGSNEPQRTVVTWTMSGKNTLISKFMSIFMNCDKIVGGQFDEGLGNLQAIFKK
jgi:Polyketide cyclase / dehydrase and lipid transport